MGLKYTAIRAAFEVLALLRAPAIARKFSASRGVILTLHRVVPEAPAAFSPNAILQVTPEFLDAVLTRLRQLHIDVVTLDEALMRLGSRLGSNPFVVLTFDDAYRDNLVHALPVLRRHHAPFTLYVPTAFVSGVGQLWWQALEDIIAARSEVFVTGTGGDEAISTASLREKNAAFARLYWQMRRQPERERLEFLGRFCARHGYDLAAQCRDLVMGWDELSEIASDPLCTIGAHTVNHYELAKLDETDALAEMVDSATILEQRLGRRPQHFSYPLGGPLSCGPREFALARDAGFRSAVTTRPGGLAPSALQSLHALPRVSLNGLFQQRRYIDLFASGGVFNLLGRISG